MYNMQKYVYICEFTEVVKHNNKAPRKPAPNLKTGRRSIFLSEANPHPPLKRNLGSEQCLAVPCLLKMNSSPHICASTDRRVVSFSFAPEVLPFRDMMGILQTPRENLGKTTAKHESYPGRGGGWGAWSPLPIG